MFYFPVEYFLQVYSLPVIAKVKFKKDSNGSLAVPTGLVFIRFAEGVDVESQREVINRVGYEVVQRLDYAPHTAWLRAKSGNIVDALAGISQLEAIANVENVEPQMLMEKGLK